MNQDSLSGRLRTLAKQINYYRSRAAALDKMRNHSKGRLSCTIKLQDYVGTDEAAMVDITDPLEKTQLQVLLSIMHLGWLGKQQEAENKLQEIVQRKFADKDTQDRVISYYMEDPAPQRRKGPKKSTGPENG